LASFTRHGATIHYTDTGPPSGDLEAQTVLFGHGLLFGGWMFSDQTAALRAQYRCVAIDWRGQGGSSAGREGYDMDTLTDDALALIDMLGVAPVHYVGLSMGGFVGLRLASRRTEKLRSLVLLDTSAEAEESRAARRYKMFAAVYRLTGILPLAPAIAHTMFGPSFRRDPSNRPVLKHWIGTLRRSSRSDISRAVLAVANRTPVTDELPTITVPTLVIVGADDVALPPLNAVRIAKRITGARLHTIDHCGHSSSLEQPATINQLLHEFLSQHQ
jgi:pimeloyl-ACP methyl ester carboxylesterase